jgi:amino acid permease
MPIAAYSYVFHHSIPSLAHPVPIEHKGFLGKIFSFAIVLSFVAYVLVAVVLSLYFQTNTLSPSNLNWETYLGELTHFFYYDYVH